MGGATGASTGALTGASGASGASSASGASVFTSSTGASSENVLASSVRLFFSRGLAGSVSFTSGDFPGLADATEVLPAAGLDDTRSGSLSRASKLFDFRFFICFRPVRAWRGSEFPLTLRGSSGANKVAGAATDSAFTLDGGRGEGDLCEPEELRRFSVGAGNFNPVTRI